MGSPTRCEPHGDGVTVVVAGVTTWKARLGKPVVGPRVTGEPLEPDAATRNAERPKGEKRQLASRMLENKHVRFARRADGKGPRERYLVSRLSYFPRKSLKSSSIWSHGSLSLSFSSLPCRGIPSGTSVQEI